MATNQPLTRHITRIYRDATVTQRVDGGYWYRAALSEATDMAVEYSVPIATAVGVIAALSPRMPWGSNLRATRRMLDGQRDGIGLTKNVDKATAIILGVDPLVALGGDKVRNFYRAIISCGRDGVVIDRHAYDVATNTRHVDATRPSLTHKQYEAAADCYRRAAAALTRSEGHEISACDVQATTWLAWRARFWSEGAWS